MPGNQGRYVVAEGWDHHFDWGQGLTRWVFDREAKDVAFMQVEEDGEWRRADRAEREDVEDSLLTANPEAIDVPETMGLVATDNLPDWAAAPAPGPR